MRSGLALVPPRDEADKGLASGSFPKAEISPILQEIAQAVLQTAAHRTLPATVPVDAAARRDRHEAREIRDGFGGVMGAKVAQTRHQLNNDLALNIFRVLFLSAPGTAAAVEGDGPLPSEDTPDDRAGVMLEEAV
jgi:hypothetical protein